MWNASRNSHAVTTAIGQAADGATDSRHRQGMNEAYSRTTPISAQKPVPTGPPTSIELGPPLRYTGTRLRPGEIGQSGAMRPASSKPFRIYLQYIKGLMMSSTFDQIANIIAETCDIPRDTIKPESHAIDDLGIDSLDFLDIAFAIDKAFGIKMPLEKWTQEVNDGKATTEQYFVLKNLADRIDELVAAKNAGTGTGA